MNVNCKENKKPINLNTVKLVFLYRDNLQLLP